jgi:hypothetical protein
VKSGIVFCSQSENQKANVMHFQSKSDGFRTRTVEADQYSNAISQAKTVSLFLTIQIINGLDDDT